MKKALRTVFSGSYGLWLSGCDANAIADTALADRSTFTALTTLSAEGLLE